jgi:5-methylcytosine-specific restriction endonuclease McrA
MVRRSEQSGRNDALRKKHRAQIARAKPACHICGKEIDYSLPYPDPMCFVVDHVVAVANGGSDLIDNKKAAHHSCNSKKRARDYAPIIRRSGALDR